MRKYVFRKADDTYSQPVGLTRLMTVAATKVVAGKGPFSITQDGEAIAQSLSRTDCLSKFRSFIKNRPLGPVFRIRKGNGDVVFAARAVKVDLVDDANTTSGNTRADVYWNWIRDRFAGYSPRFAGAYVCKYVSGSSNLSQHSYGNAVDIFFNTLDHQHLVAKAVVANADVLHPYHVISKNQIWTKGQGWRTYTGVYHSHLHVDFDPQYSGACGVRG